MNLSFLNTPFRARLVFFILFAAISICYYKEMIFSMPKGIHEWAQADRLALAMNFYDNGMNFFKPATYSLYSDRGITGVEFPIQSYLAALTGFISGRQNIHIAFRLIDLLVSLTGLYFLFITCYDKTKNIALSLFAPLFIFCAPLYIYYTCNFLPDTAALSLTFIAYYYFIKFTDTNNLKDLIPSILWISFATLIKTSAGIYLIALLLHTIVYMLYHRNIFKTKSFIKVSLVAGAGISIIVFYLFYNKYLNATYHSEAFLSTARPIKERELFRYLIEERIMKLWLYEYLIHPQYYAFFLIALNGLVIMFWNFKTHIFFLGHLFIAGIGACIVFLLMSAQFIDHDYYALCIFYPLIALTLVISLIQIGIKLPEKSKPIFNLNFVIIGYILFYCANRHHSARISDYYPPFSVDYRHFWMEGGAQKLVNAGISKEAKIVVLGEYSPNLGLVYFDRKGIHSVTDPKNFKASDFNNFMDQFHAEYIVVSNQFYNELASYHAEEMTTYKTISKDDLCVILKK